MERSYLIEVLNTLSSEEMEAFGLFLANPQFQSKRQFEDMQRLFGALIEEIEHGQEPTLDKEQIYFKVFPESVFIEGKLEKLMAELNKMLRQFLLIQHYLRPENAVPMHLDLIEILEKRGLESRKAQAIQKLAKQQDGVRQRGPGYFYYQSRLERIIHDHETRYNQQKGNLNIPNVIQNLDIFHHLNRLEMLNRFLLQQRPAQLEVEEPIRLALEESTVPSRYLEQSVELRVRYKIFQLLCQKLPARSEFEDLLEQLRQHHKELTEDSLKEVYTYLRNFCVILINSGAKDLLHVLHTIQKENLEQGYLYYQGGLSPSALLSVVVTAIRVKEFDWLLKFLEAHRGKIIGDNETKDLYRLNKALYLFATGQFEQALDFVPEKLDMVLYHLMARRLEIKIYYEMQSDLVQYKLDAYKMFISRASKKFLSENLRKPNAAFVNLLYQILQSTPGDQDRVEQLLQRISEKKTAADREWLEEKVQELGN